MIYFLISQISVISVISEIPGGVPAPCPQPTPVFSDLIVLRSDQVLDSLSSLSLTSSQSQTFLPLCRILTHLESRISASATK